MPTIEELSALNPDFLARALELAKERETKERIANLPKCQCGKPATQAAVAVITYKFAAIIDDAYSGGARLGRFKDETDYCPGKGGPEDDQIWICCDSETCSTDLWRSVPCTAIRTY